MAEAAGAIARGRRLAAPPAVADRPARRVPFALAVLVSLAVCALVSLLPNESVLVLVKLAAATYATLVLPGAVILRLLGWPRSPADALPACAAWSVTALAPGFVLMLLSDRGFVVMPLWLLLVIGVGLLVGRGKPVEMDLRLSWSLLWFVGPLVLFSALLWIGSWNNIGDAVEHIARMRKISELDPPRSLDELGLLPPGSGLHPGYAFPLWHATGAVVAWTSGLDDSFVFRFWPSFLVFLVAAAVYRAGRTMFGCRAAGVAAFVAYLGAFAFPGGVGFFSQLSYPGYAAIFLFWPLVIARTFTFLREGGREPVLTVAAASFVVSAIHPSYAPFMVLLIGAFLIARTVMTRDRGDLRRLAVMVGATTVPFLLFLIWLYPTADASASTVGRASRHFGTLVNTTGDLVSMKAEWVTRGGPAVIAALLLVPLASAATRTRAAAFIGGTSATVILILIVPWLFTPFADILSISQARRFLFYLPFAFALTGGALVLARFRYLAAAGALIAGALLYLAWPGNYSYHLDEPGPAWPAWFAGIGAVVVLAVGAATKLNLRYVGGWAVAIVVAVILPVAATGIRGMPTYRPAPGDFSEGLLAAVRTYVTRDDIILALPKVGYRLTAKEPVYIVAAAGGHGGDTVVNQHSERRKAADDFFDGDTSPAEAQAIVDRWDVQWVLVRKDLPRWSWPQRYLDQFEPVYEDGRYALYPVDPAILPRVEALQRASSTG